MKALWLVSIALLALLQEDRRGTPEQMAHYKVATQYNLPESVDPNAEAAARNASSFGPRYAAAILRIHRVFAKGAGYQDLYQALLAQSGGPKEAGPHFAALAEGIRKAVCCSKCENGKVRCPHCEGKKKFDMKCPKCDGKGFIHAKGEVNAKVLQRCNTCAATGMIKNTVCNLCSVAGYIDCPECKGTPWRQESCSNPECRGGKVTCQRCKGKGEVLEKCSECQGKKRVVSPGASAGFKVTQKCRSCDGEGTQKEDCGACGKSGKVLCDICKGKFESQRVQASLADVFSTTPCGACGGSGWPEAGKAIACPQCLGLGVRIIPTSDGTKVLVGN